MIIIPIKQLPGTDDLPLPRYATEDSAGMDLMAANSEAMVLAKGKRILVKTGISLALPKGYEAQIRPRSGLALKHGITVLNTPGTIDADYRGEIAVILINLGEEDFIISRGMRIAQMIIGSYHKVTFKAVEDLEQTDRGNSGFGSTGTIQSKYAVNATS